MQDEKRDAKVAETQRDPFPGAPVHTHDLNLAAYLVARGHAVTLSGASRRRLFCFPPAASGEVAAYYDRASIPAVTYAHALRDIKTRLRE